MDTIHRQSTDQNLRKLVETAGFSDIYRQDYSGYFTDITDYKYLNGKSTVHKTFHQLIFSVSETSKTNSSSISRITLLYIKKVDYIIRDV